jgi:hypothetical protein
MELFFKGEAQLSAARKDVPLFMLQLGQLRALKMLCLDNNELSVSRHQARSLPSWGS